MPLLLCVQSSMLDMCFIYDYGHLLSPSITGEIRRNLNQKPSNPNSMSLTLPTQYACFCFLTDVQDLQHKELCREQQQRLGKQTQKHCCKIRTPPMYLDKAASLEECKSFLDIELLNQSLMWSPTVSSSISEATFKMPPLYLPRKKTRNESSWKGERNKNTLVIYYRISLVFFIVCLNDRKNAFKKGHW